MDPIRAYEIQFGKPPPHRHRARVVYLTNEAMTVMSAKRAEAQEVDLSGPEHAGTVSLLAEINTALMGHDLRMKRLERG